MPAETQPQSNYDSLLRHLKDDSLASQLVQAYRSSEASGSTEAMKAVLTKLLSQIRAKIDNT